MVNNATDSQMIPFTKFAYDDPGNTRAQLRRIAFLPLMEADEARFVKMLPSYSADMICEIAKFLKTQVGSRTLPANAFYTKLA